MGPSTSRRLWTADLATVAILLCDWRVDRPVLRHGPVDCRRSYEAKKAVFTGSDASDKYQRQ